MNAAGAGGLVGALARHGAAEARVALVLGSGLGAFSARLADAKAVPYAELEGLPRSAVPGHAGRLVLGEVGGVRVAVFEGRAHRYEGWSAEQVTRGVRALAALGVPALVLTNASGGIVESWTPPLLMRVTDHIDLQSTRLSFPDKGLRDVSTCASISGELQVETRGHRRRTRRADEQPEEAPQQDPQQAPRQDPQQAPQQAPRQERPEGSRSPQRDDKHSSPYDPELGRALELAAREAGIPLFHGIYAGLLGPTYETPAEIRMLRWIGADAVGMSTVAEAAAAHAAGMRVAAVSCVTNAAAGLSPGPLSHDEVVAAGARVSDEFCELLAAAVPRIAALADGNQV